MLMESFFLVQLWNNLYFSTFSFLFLFARNTSFVSGEGIFPYLNQTCQMIYLFLLFTCDQKEKIHTLSCQNLSNHMYLLSPFLSSFSATPISSFRLFLSISFYAFVNFHISNSTLNLDRE